jgi:integrase
LVFPTAGGNVNNKLLRTCKRLAAKAGLDPERFWLHKFRAHHATHCLRSGMDVETLKRHLGHSKDSKSIWCYLLALQGEARGEKITQIWAPIPVKAHEPREYAALSVSGRCLHQTTTEQWLCFS